jgi:hypothetical protein
MRYAQCLAFAQMAARRTGRNVSILSLTSGKFRAIFTETAVDFGLTECITHTVRAERGL